MSSARSKKKPVNWEKLHQALKNPETDSILLSRLVKKVGSIFAKDPSGNSILTLANQYKNEKARTFIKWEMVHESLLENSENLPYYIYKVGGIHVEDPFIKKTVKELMRDVYHYKKRDYEKLKWQVLEEALLDSNIQYKDLALIISDVGGFLKKTPENLDMDIFAIKLGVSDDMVDYIRVRMLTTSVKTNDQVKLPFSEKCKMLFILGGLGAKIPNTTFTWEEWFQDHDVTQETIDKMKWECLFLAMKDRETRPGFIKHLIEDLGGFLKCDENGETILDWARRLAEPILLEYIRHEVTEAVKVQYQIDREADLSMLIKNLRTPKVTYAEPVARVQEFPKPATPVTTPVLFQPQPAPRQATPPARVEEEQMTGCCVPIRRR